MTERRPTPPPAISIAADAIRHVLRRLIKRIGMEGVSQFSQDMYVKYHVKI
jgi:hypothetical protein